MRRSTILAAISTLSAVCCGPAAPLHAQTITPLVMEGDVLPGGDVVSQVVMVDVSDPGHWIAVVDVDPSASATWVVLANGFEVARSGDAIGGAAVGTFERMLSTPSLDVLGGWVATGAVGGVAPTEQNALIVSGDVAALRTTACGAPGAPAGATYHRFDATWIDEGIDLLARVTLDSPSTGQIDALLRLRADPFSPPMVEELVVREGDVLPGQTEAVASISDNEAGCAYNARHDAAYVVTLTGPASTNGAVYKNDELIAQEGSPTGAPGSTWANLDFARVALNDRGQVAVLGVLQGGHEAIAFDGRLIGRTGDAVFGHAGFTHAGFDLQTPIEVSSAGDVAYIADVQVPGGFVQKALFCDRQMVARMTDTAVAGSVIANFSASDRALRMSDDGRYIVFRAVLQNGLEGAFLVDRGDRTIDFCAGDGQADVFGPAAPCPCANASLPGDRVGCMNSQGRGAYVTAHGSLVAANGDTVFSLYDARPNQPAMLVQGSIPIKAPFRDGILCMGGATERIEAVFTSADGHASTTVDVAVEGNITAPDGRGYQFWYRDPAISVCGTGSNLSQAVVVLWQ